MKILILSCKTGGGHDAAGFAVKERLELEGHEAIVFDYLTLAGERVAHRVGNLYVNTVKKAPRLFGIVYQIGMFVSRIMSKSPVYFVNGKMAKYLTSYLKENHFDAIVMPHLYPAETITYMKKKNVKLPLTVGIATDYTCIPFWEETCCDYYVIPHKSLIKEFSKRGIPSEKIEPLGIPVSPEFLLSINKKSARLKLGLPPEKPLFLIVGGSMGAGRIKNLTQAVWQVNAENAGGVVICGSNKKVYDKLRRKYRNNEKVYIIGHTKRMPLYMKACDILYTKPGGLTSTEAAVSEIPMIHTQPIPGCETANRKFFRKTGMSLSSKNIIRQAVLGKKLLNSPAVMQKMKDAQKQMIAKEASKEIVRLIEKGVRAHSNELKSDHVGTERIAYVKDNTKAMLYRLWMIKEAKKEIIMSTFEFHADDGGKNVIAALLHAAEQGVKIRILVDGITGFLELKKSPWFQAFDMHENISIKIYNAVCFSNLWRIQKRMHDKYLIIDDNMYLLGGRNTTDLFLGNDSSKKNIDRELFVYETKLSPDSSLVQLKAYFEKIWKLPECTYYQSKKGTEKKFLRRKYSVLRERHEEIYSEFPNANEKQDWIANTMETQKVTLLTNQIEAKKKQPKLWKTLNKIMLTGNKIIIHTPYIVCGREMYRDLRELTKKVDSVKIITNDMASGANPWGCSDYLNERKKIWKTGVKVYEFLGNYSSHKKIILVDDRISILGSFNLDMRSTYLDTELMLAVDCARLNQILQKEAESDIERSRVMGPDGVYVYGKNYKKKKLTRKKRLTYAIIRTIIRPIRHLL